MELLINVFYLGVRDVLCQLMPCLLVSPTHRQTYYRLPYRSTLSSTYVWVNHIQIRIYESITPCPVDRYWKFEKSFSLMESDIWHQSGIFFSLGERYKIAVWYSKLCTLVWLKAVLHRKRISTNMRCIINRQCMCRILLLFVTFKRCNRPACIMTCMSNFIRCLYVMQLLNQVWT